MFIYNIALWHSHKNLKSRSININSIENEFLTTLNTLKSEEMDAPINNNACNNCRELLKNSYDLLKFHTICQILLIKGDRNIYELTFLTGDYYDYLRKLSEKLMDGRSLSSEDYDIYKKIHYNMYLIKSKISNETYSKGKFEDISMIFDEIQNELIEI